MAPSDPHRLLVRNRNRVLALAERRGSRDVYKMLEEARRDLKARLAALPRSSDGQFTPERMKATLRQIEHVMTEVAKQLEATGRESIKAAAEYGVEHTVDYLHRSERKFRGVTVPLALDRAAAFDSTLNGVQSTLLRQFPRSVKRYGLQSIEKFEDRLRQGVLQQKTMDAVVADVASSDTFFEGRRYWAERIVRTETMDSYGRASQAAIQVTYEEDWPDMRKVLVGFFDSRTGPDTPFMDGQVRKPDDPFVWRGPYAGSRPPFMNTPKRPNCRCTTVAWRPDWPTPPTQNPLWGDLPRRRRSR